MQRRRFSTSSWTEDKAEGKQSFLEASFYSFKFSALKFLTLLAMTVHSHRTSPLSRWVIPWALTSNISHGLSSSNARLHHSLGSGEHLVSTGIPTQLFYEVSKIISSHVSARET